MPKVPAAFEYLAALSLAAKHVTKPEYFSAFCDDLVADAKEAGLDRTINEEQAAEIMCVMDEARKWADGKIKAFLGAHN